jgi:hypothetical protein
MIPELHPPGISLNARGLAGPVDLWSVPERKIVRRAQQTRPTTRTDVRARPKAIPVPRILRRREPIERGGSAVSRPAAVRGDDRDAVAGQHGACVIEGEPAPCGPAVKDGGDAGAVGTSRSGYRGRSPGGRDSHWRRPAARARTAAQDSGNRKLGTRAVARGQPASVATTDATTGLDCSAAAAEIAASTVSGSSNGSTYRKDHQRVGVGIAAPLDDDLGILLRAGVDPNTRGFSTPPAVPTSSPCLAQSSAEEAGAAERAGGWGFSADEGKRQRTMVGARFVLLWSDPDVDRDGDDGRFAVLVELLGRLELQRERLAVQGLIGQLSRAEHRVLLAVWHPAESWGRG